MLNRQWIGGIVALGCVCAASVARAQSNAPAEGEDDLEIPVTAAPRAVTGSSPAAVAPPPPAVNTSAATPVQSAAPAVPSVDELRALHAQIAQLETRLRALETPPAAPAPTPAPAPAPAPAPPTFLSALMSPPVQPDGERFLDPVGLLASGYLQVEYQSSQLSEDQIQQGGAPYNRDRFLLRRARVRFDASWQYALLTLELDTNTVNGPYVSVRRAEASVLYRSATRGLPPYAMLTAGVTDIPFGTEMTEGARRRVFMERTLGSRAFFRGEPDLGVKLTGGVGFVRYSLAAMNGSPIDDRGGAGSGIALTSGKDVIGRVGVDTGPSNDWQFAGGVSFLAGTGLHAGSEATSNRVVWRDLNENSVIDAGELTAVPGRAATPSQTFAHWGLDVDLALRVHTRLGWTRVSGEAALGTNLDRAIFVADPIAAGLDVRELSAFVAVVQDVTRYGFIGLRYDYYNPNADYFDNRRGALVPSDASIHTLSPVVGVALPGYARLVFQYDAIFDALARDARGVPTDLRNDQWTLRLQGEF